MRIHAVIGLLILAACETPTGVRQIAGRALSDARSESAPVHVVTGGGQLVGADWTETYGFTAQIDGAGNVNGQVEMHIVGVPALHGNVTCLAVDGNSAWVGGIATSSQDETQVPIGTQFWFRVQDSGQGPDAVDRISTIRLGPLASICSERRAVAVPWQLLRGNIVVR